MEKRGTPRLPVAMQVVYKVDQEFVNSYLYDINGGGVFIQTPDPLDPGTPLEICFHVPGLPDPFNVQVTVVWKQASEESSRSGMGVRFIRMRLVDRLRLTSFLEVFK